MLDIYYSVPLEREYEAWIMAAIEIFLKERGLSCSTFAVSPFIEPMFPADEIVLYKGKLVGLQFKQPHLPTGTKPPISSDRLRWTFHSPKGQFSLVQSIDYIYYALPTFLDRRYANHALHHTLFWRPSTSDMNAWYDNPKAATPSKKIMNEMRWGLFFEGIVQCPIGTKVEENGLLSQLFPELVTKISNITSDQNGSDAPIYFINIKS